MHHQVVTVFGGTGFLGREICRLLVDSGWIVRIAARHPQVALPGVSGDHCERFAVDVRDETRVAHALEGASAAVNAVSLYVEHSGLHFEDVHVRGAGHVARCAHEAGVDRLVHISGIGVDLHSPSKYVRTRARGEERVRSYFPSATVLRPSVLFGPGGAFIKALRRAGVLPVVPLFGRGRTCLQPVYVEDVARAVTVALHRPDSVGRIFELGGGQVAEYRDIVRTVLAATGRRRRLLPVPFRLWMLVAFLLRVMPNPPLTQDQIILMESDNVVGTEVAGFKALDLEPRGFDEMLTVSLAKP